MGNIVSNDTARPRPLGRLDKIEIKICCQQLFSHLSLQLNKKADEFKAKELELVKLLRNPYFDHTDLGLTLSSALKALRYLKACKLVMKFARVIEEKAGVIEAAVSKGGFGELDFLMPYIESIIWSTAFLNLQQIKPFTAMVFNYFGPTIFGEVKEFRRVDVELRECREEAPAGEMSNYLEGVIARHQIPNVTAKEVLSGVRASYNPFSEMPAPPDQFPPANPQNANNRSGENDQQIREIGNMLDGFELDRKNSIRSLQAYMEVVKKLRAVGV